LSNKPTCTIIIHYRMYNKYGAYILKKQIWCIKKHYLHSRLIVCTDKMSCYTHKETLIFLSVKNYSFCKLFSPKFSINDIVFYIFLLEILKFSISNRMVFPVLRSLFWIDAYILDAKFESNRTSDFVVNNILFAFTIALFCFFFFIV
jgi:hypothetical protein